MKTQWPVRHPGIGVLYYDSEEEARIAAGTAAEMLRPTTSLRLVVPSPGSWLTSRDPAKGRIALYDQWRVQARSCLAAAQAADWHELIPTAVASVQVRLAPGVDRRGPQAYQASWHAVRQALDEVGVNVAREHLMWFGLPDPHGGQLVVELRPLVVRRREVSRDQAG